MYQYIFPKSKPFIFFNLFLLLILCSFPIQTEAKRNKRKLTINIIANDNGVGVSKDINILKTELENLGHSVKSGLHDYHNLHQKADINIFIEHIIKKHFRLAKKHFFLPNPEWLMKPELLKYIDLILCRNKYIENIFSNFKKKLFHLGFTSEDHYTKEMDIDYSLILHSIGKSIHKGSQSVANVWNKRPDFPVLTYHDVLGNFPCNSSNIQYINTYLPEKDYKKMQNLHGIHLCPSQSKGFGHYIFEAMSCGALVLTTDAPPMNEYIDDPSLKVKTLSHEKHNFGYVYTIDEEDLEKKLEYILLLSEEERRQIGKRNRLFYLERKKEFLNNLKNLFS